MPLASVDDALLAFWRGMRPDPLLTVSEWADQRRVLSSKASSEHGPWRTSRTPYLRKPMDDLSATSTVQEVVLVFPAQSGKSEALNNWMGYVMDIQPGPALFVQPTIDMAKRYSKMRIAPMIEATPSLQEKVKAPRERDSGNTQLMKEFTGGFLILGGANAASGLASMPIRFLGGDEIDRWPADVDEEGSPLAIVSARTRTFGVRKKQAWTSTPTIAGRSQIWAKWEQSNQQRLLLPCPHCQHRQVLEWDRLRYDAKDPGLPSTLRTPPVLICEECGTGIEEDTKAWWYDPDVFSDDWWEALFPERDVQGYHLNGLYSPLGWLSWTEIAVSYEQAKDNPAELKPWTNTVLAECWNDDGELEPRLPGAGGRHRAAGGVARAVEVHPLRVRPRRWAAAADPDDGDRLGLQEPGGLPLGAGPGRQPCDRGEGPGGADGDHRHAGPGGGAAQWQGAARRREGVAGGREHGEERALRLAAATDA
ncbi:MAG: phage terminase large subunit family protein [Synechococcaceae bacterium WB4_1_0192]|nr:phage terminase large subunit family protein [Synechococcaceae bacterium WB4_1_0192]